ncbi:hypothetical protein KZI27_15785 [Curtobacterium sp. TC1]|uniref:hypothetical protein n=1 Tax=Curtobacterium sp. TC1 TaxID=2862880 RepID=UPI001C9B09B8|nr:hypothetical protein [Curtobacterium sp. TC1]QZQ54728.1 hypothetical protein KZI27_15785 [Curtobacterium sp. TC1]
MTHTLVPPTATPAPAPRADLIFTAHYGAQRSPLTEVQHARWTRRLAVVAVTTGLVSVTVATVAIVVASAW